MTLHACKLLLLTLAVSACAGPGPGEFKGCATSAVKAGDRMKANGQDVTVERVIGPSKDCTIDRPIEAVVKSSAP